MNEPDRTKTDSEAKWGWQFFVAVGMLLGFAAIVSVMIVLADGDETQWQRRVYVFGAVQAIVFTAVGWIFGREVNRSAVESASEEAQQVRGELSEARNEARTAFADAAAAEAHATQERTKGQAVQAAARHFGTSVNEPRKAPRDVSQSDRSDPPVELVKFSRFVHDLYDSSKL